jgi:hypothetical protein
MKHRLWPETRFDLLANDSELSGQSRPLQLVLRFYSIINLQSMMSNRSSGLSEAEFEHQRRETTRQTRFTQNRPGHDTFFSISRRISTYL